MKPESAVRAILFDAGWTLIYPKPTRKEAIQDYLWTLGYTIPSDVFESANNAAAIYYNLHRWQPEAIANLAQFWDTYYDILVRRLGLTDPGLKIALQIHGESAVKFYLYPETLYVMQALHERGFLIGVVSNWSAALLEILENLGLKGYLDSIVVSDIVGYHKPQPEIFRYALASLQVYPQEAIHIGDDFDADVEGARSVGIRPIWLDRVGMGKRNPTERIRSLHELDSHISQITSSP